jgi:hypothetical protein
MTVVLRDVRRDRAQLRDLMMPRVANAVPRGQAGRTLATRVGAPDRRSYPRVRWGRARDAARDGQADRLPYADSLRAARGHAVRPRGHPMTLQPTHQGSCPERAQSCEDNQVWGFAHQNKCATSRICPSDGPCERCEIDVTVTQLELPCHIFPSFNFLAYEDLERQSILKIAQDTVKEEQVLSAVHLQAVIGHYSWTPVMNGIPR